VVCIIYEQNIHGSEARCYLSSKQGIVIYKRDKPYKIEDEEPEGIGSLF